MTTKSAYPPRLLALGWAAFVACSWTWCIGMYLPVLMVRDYGPAGWFVFAIPNVIGAAAMGWILNRPDAAASISRKHWHAAAAFSLVTILFHAFFVGWLIRSLIGDAAEIIVGAAAVAFYFFGRRGNRDLLTAAIVLAISVIAFVVAASLPEHYVPGRAGIPSETGLFYLAPVCIFGFLLCPYLDLTFLRARAATAPFAGIAAFTIGFGIFFLAMILFTFWYARILQPSTLPLVPRTLAWIIAGHMTLQSAVTVALHTRAISEDPRARDRSTVDGFFIAVILAFVVGVWCQHGVIARPHAGETVYRIFMAFYGLVFPAYVWLCMIPSRSRYSAPAPIRLIILGGVILVALPMYWVAFIDNRMVWLAPALAIILLSRILVNQFTRIR